MFEFIKGVFGNLVSGWLVAGGNFLLKQATADSVEWQAWKAKYHLTDSDNDFLVRFAEALVATLDTEQKRLYYGPFFKDAHTIQLFCDCWYGRLDSEAFSRKIGEQVRRFTLSEADQAEIHRFLKALAEAVHSGRSAADAETHRRIVAIEEIVRHIAAGEAGRTAAPERPVIHTSRLPYDPSAIFVGREAELRMLDEAWEDPGTRIVELVAMGGAGKTALVGQWLENMADRDYRGAMRVYAWSFYSQGAGEQRQSSADSFLVDMLKWFGEDVTTLPIAFRDRALLLAGHIRRRPTLLLLDGLEPLQQPPGPETGKLKDPGLACLLRELAAHNPGLCVLTTRIETADLSRYAGQGLRRHPLERLSDAEGAKLLAALGVKGAQKDLETVAHEYEGHALALQLLGNYLREVHQGDLRRRDRIRALTREEQRGNHAKRVLEAYVQWFSDGAHGPELALLYLMGLFDRPAPVAALDALAGDTGLGDWLTPLRAADAERQTRAFRHVEKLNLLRAESGARLGAAPTHLPGLEAWEEFDAHPLIREFFGEKMEATQAEAFRRAHGILYEYYRNLPKKELPDTLEEMEPLFAAVMHGCRAGRQQETLDEVFWKRIQRGKAAYSIRQLGAFGANLTASAWFFEKIWNKPSHKLTEGDQAWIINDAGYALRALGRLGEAAQPMQAAMEMCVHQLDWKNAPTAASNLSQLYLATGDVPRAVEMGKKGVEYADKSGDGFQNEVNRIAYADALHAAGDPDAALQWFETAEAMQRERQPEYRFLYSVQGFQYCDLLLSLGRWEEVLARAEQTLEWAKQYLSLLAIALDHLSLGKAHTLLFQQNLSETHRAAAEQQLNLTVAGLEKAGYQEDTPRGFLARAHFRRLIQDWVGAAQDLAAVYEIAEPGGMRLHLCDYHLESARLALAQAAYTQDGAAHERARAHCEQAQALVAATGYYRRKGEISEIMKNESEFYWTFSKK